MTFPSEYVAEQICEMLVNEGTIACANVFAPIKSIYRWKNELHKDQEWSALLKLNPLKKGALKERIRATHPYENPCLIFVSIDDGLPEFLNWVRLQSL